MSTVHDGWNPNPIPLIQQTVCSDEKEWHLEGKLTPNKTLQPDRGFGHKDVIVGKRVPLHNLPQTLGIVVPKYGLQVHTKSNGDVGDEINQKQCFESFVHLLVVLYSSNNTFQNTFQNNSIHFFNYFLQ